MKWPALSRFFSRTLRQAASAAGGFSLPDLDMGLVRSDWSPGTYPHVNITGGNVTRNFAIWDQVNTKNEPNAKAVRWTEVTKVGVVESDRKTCYQLNLSDSNIYARTIGKGVAAQSLLVALDLALWRLASGWDSNFTELMEKASTGVLPASEFDSLLSGESGILSAGIAVSFTDPGTIPEPLEDGLSCSVGETCQFAISKSRYKRLGDGNGGNGWGYCADDIPPEGYSVANCQRKALIPVIKTCDRVLNGRLNQSVDVEQQCYENEVAAGKFPVCYPACDETVWSAQQSSADISKFLLNSYAHDKQTATQTRWKDHLKGQLFFWWMNQVAVESRAGYKLYPSYMDSNGNGQTLSCAQYGNCSYSELDNYMRQNMVFLKVFPKAMQVIPRPDRRPDPR